MPAPTFDRILIALKATNDRNVNYHFWMDFCRSESYGWQECQLPLLIKFWWLWSLGSIECQLPLLIKFWWLWSLGSMECQLPLLIKFWWLWRLGSMGMLTSTVDKILVALKATVNKSVNFQLLQDSGISKSNN